MIVTLADNTSNRSNWRSKVWYYHAQLVQETQERSQLVLGVKSLWLPGELSFVRRRSTLTAAGTHLSPKSQVCFVLVVFGGISSSLFRKKKKRKRQKQPVALGSAFNQPVQY